MKTGNALVKKFLLPINICVYILQEYYIHVADANRNHMSKLHILIGQKFILVFF